MLGLVSEDGQSLDAACDRVNQRGVFVLDKLEDSITFTGVASRPVPSLFRGFSAPVNVSLDFASEDLLVLLRHDTDAFNRWQAAQTRRDAHPGRPVDRRRPCRGRDRAPLSSAFRSFMDTDGLSDPAFAALVLTLPSEADIAQEIGKDVDPDAIHRARNDTAAPYRASAASMRCSDSTNS